jgi:hypothetical protein
MDLAEVLKKKRPNLSDGSLRTYKSILTNLYRKCYPDDDEIDVEKLNNEKHMLDHLKDIPYAKRKTTLAALVVLTGNKHYSTQMMDDIGKYNDEQMLQQKDGKFAENMIPFAEVETILKRLETEAKHVYKKETSLTMADLQKVQNFIILALTGGIYQPPRRSLDWVMKIRNYDTSEDNYLDMKGKRFVFNKYKTGAQKGQQVTEVPKPLLAILKKWISVLPADEEHLLFDNKGGALTPSQITHRLNTVFDKKIGTSMLRHIYATSKFGDVKLKELADTATAMGNSPVQLLKYVKTD